MQSAGITAERGSRIAGFPSIGGHRTRGHDLEQHDVIAWLVMHHWLQDYEYRIEISGWIFVTAGGMALLIAIITISFQAIRAAIANPVKSLRSE